MTFRDPILLSGLLLIPIAMLAYVALQRRRQREAAAFANPALVGNLVTARPGWRRHVPPLLLALALAALVVALARPEHTVAAPQRAATVMMVTDVSGSMNATDVDPDRLTAAQKAARKLAEELPPVGDLWLVDPETGRQLQVNTSSRRLRRRFAAAATRDRDEVAQAFRHARAEHLVLSTEGDWLRELAGHLRRSEHALRGMRMAGR